jgi:hypothetical protein
MRAAVVAFHHADGPCLQVYGGALGGLDEGVGFLHG